MNVLAILTGWAVGLAGLLLVGAGLSQATLGLARSTMRSPRMGSVGGLGLRRLYGAVLWATCVYFYVSVLLGLALLMAAGLLVVRSTIEDMGFTRGEAAFVPVMLNLALVAVVVSGLWKIVGGVLRILWRSWIHGPKIPEDWIRVGRGEQFHLVQAVNAVAKDLGAKPIETIFLTSTPRAAVFELGGLVQQLTGKSEACLLLGIGILDGLTVGELKAILAHEYGHVVSGDTAGGRFALAVRRALANMAEGLAWRGTAFWYIPAWMFLAGFRPAFLRISQGASRLQEILADRTAASVYGGALFARALAATTERMVRFHYHAERSLQLAVEFGVSVPNLYQHRPASRPEDARAIQEAIAAALDDETPYASHPSSRNRIAWVEAFPAGRRPSFDDDAPAWSLLSGREELERQMTAQIRDAAAAAHGYPLPRSSRGRSSAA